MTALVLDRDAALTRTRPRPTLADTVSQTMSMAWRATKKMRRNPEQFFDVTIQPLLFTAMFAYIFGGAVSGSVQQYLPLMIPGILAQTALTACMATGTQLREDMDKGVFDRFKSLPIARIAPLAGPMSPYACWSSPTGSATTAPCPPRRGGGSRRWPRSAPRVRSQRCGSSTATAAAPSSSTRQGRSSRSSGEGHIFRL